MYIVFIDEYDESYLKYYVTKDYITKKRKRRKITDQNKQSLTVEDKGNSGKHFNLSYNFTLCFIITSA